MATLKDIEAQGKFLLQHHEELLESCSTELVRFKDRLTQMVKSKECSEQDRARLSKIQGQFDEKMEEVTQALSRDIDRLKDECEAIKRVEGVQDNERRAQLEELFLKDFEELDDFEAFKKEVSAEALQTRNDFNEIIDDLITTLEEGGLTQLEAYIDAMGLAEDADEESGALPDSLSDDEGAELVKQALEELGHEPVALDESQESTEDEDGEA